MSNSDDFLGFFKEVMLETNGGVKVPNQYQANTSDIVHKQITKAIKHRS